MGLTLRNLNAGWLPLETLTPTSARVILPGSTTKATLVRDIVLTNTDTAPRRVTLYAYINGTEYPITPLDFTIPGGANVVLDNVITLFVTSTVTDQLTAKAEVASKIAFVISGFDRDV